MPPIERSILTTYPSLPRPFQYPVQHEHPSHWVDRLPFPLSGPPPYWVGPGPTSHQVSHRPPPHQVNIVLFFIVGLLFNEWVVELLNGTWSSSLSSASYSSSQSWTSSSSGLRSSTFPSIQGQGYRRCCLLFTLPICWLTAFLPD